MSGNKSSNSYGKNRAENNTGANQAGNCGGNNASSGGKTTEHERKKSGDCNSSTRTGGQNSTSRSAR
jgi:hypothetical protein